MAKRTAELTAEQNEEVRRKLARGIDPASIVLPRLNAASARPALPAGEMNKTEAAYSRHLDHLQSIGVILAWRFGSLNFRLAEKACWFKPDFLVVVDGGFEIHEVKGHWEDDARVKIKVAADLFPWFLFVAVTRDKGSWCYEYFGKRRFETSATIR
jgi:hypothetical protein